jgi:hypothetical protein
MVDDLIDIYESDGMMQINKKGGILTGGYISQWAIIFIYLIHCFSHNLSIFDDLPYRYSIDLQIPI